eukprot:Seg2316.4 transcript_id=Seg2316.4/GoldUCD/mRNA.D3Y31 product="hypothetical protein" protein_id=Seg2316.4/GoldUCD/D3Y31
MKAHSVLTIFLISISLYTIHAEVLELSEDEQGTPIWKNGEYRDRDEIPLPSSYDDEKKHKRDTSLDEPVDEEKDSDQKTDKKNLINRIHFSMPFGVGLPLYHVSKVTGKKGKKSGVPHHYRDSANKLKLDDAYDYAKLDVQTPDRKSEVSKSWGMTYDNLFQEKPKEMTGQMRSKLEAGYKIKEEDLDNGMMFRGLGGLRLRDQNHQIIEGKFADEDTDEEMDARSDVTKNSM